MAADARNLRKIPNKEAWSQEDCDKFLSQIKQGISGSEQLTVDRHEKALSLSNLVINKIKQSVSDQNQVLIPYDGKKQELRAWTEKIINSYNLTSKEISRAMSFLNGTLNKIKEENEKCHQALKMTIDQENKQSAMSCALILSGFCYGLVLIAYPPAGIVALIQGAIAVSGGASVYGYQQNVRETICKNKAIIESFSKAIDKKLDILSDLLATVNNCYENKKRWEEEQGKKRLKVEQSKQVSFFKECPKACDSLSKFLIVLSVSSVVFFVLLTLLSTNKDSAEQLGSKFRP